MEWKHLVIIKYKRGGGARISVFVYPLHGELELAFVVVVSLEVALLLVSLFYEPFVN